MRSDTELLVLTLIDRGSSAPYALASQAGLSPGTTIPLLNRLAKAGLIKFGPEGPRRRRDCILRPAGRKLLRVEGPQLVESVSADLDSALRVMFVAFPLINGRRRRDFVTAVMDRIRKSAESRRLEADRPAMPQSPEAFKQLKRQAEVERLEADLVFLGRMLKKSLSAGTKLKRGV